MILGGSFGSPILIILACDKVFITSSERAKRKKCGEKTHSEQIECKKLKIKKTKDAANNNRKNEHDYIKNPLKKITFQADSISCGGRI